jgi:hypothetical protein
MGIIWRDTDPRLSINKHSRIVILRLGLRGHSDLMAGMGTVETNHGWSITTTFDDYADIDDWPQDWQWTWAPYKDLILCNLDFGEALQLLKQGKRVARSSWNDKSKWVHLVEETEPFLAMRDAQDMAGYGWFASQADVLATDWYVVKSPAV